ncbi:hypothetical protein ACQCPO_30645 (plasmid) [Bacillus mycoides]|uniref:hypothetical protein n=1 Tax=Bacillus mycoides TaxID=1405 RepID=UPI003CEE385E
MIGLQRYTVHKNGEEYDASEFVSVMINTVAYSIGKYGAESFDGLLEQLNDSEVKVFEMFVLAVGNHLAKQTNTTNEKEKQESNDSCCVENLN